MKLPSIFGDHMVLQRGRPIPVWGVARAKTRISVTLADRTVSTIARKDRRWSVRLPQMEAGGPFEMTVTGGRSIRFRDVLVGEVWVASGQSNMELTVKEAGDPEKVVAAAEYPEIRVFTVSQLAVVEPQTDAQGSWQVCSRRTAGGFSAVGYHFARALQKELKLPVGIVVSAWGGTRAEAWTPREALASSPRFKKVLEQYERRLRALVGNRAVRESDLHGGMENLYPADPGNSGWARGWADVTAPVADWKTMRLPRYWQNDGYKFSGIFWFRKEVEVPAEWAGRDLILNLCPCDKQDTTYFNNQRVGGMGDENANAWSTPRRYPVPGRLVKAGRNVIAVRIYSFVYAGGMMGDPAQMNLRRADRPKARPIPLAGKWRFRIEHDFGFIRPVHNSPYALFRGMIEPMIPYAIRGAIWYQGESNADEAWEYRFLFPLMIGGWRKAWKQGDFPFLFVQLPNYSVGKNEPGEGRWAELREAQAMALRLPQTGMAVTTDVGDANDVHPKNKHDVGARLAAWALNRVYHIASVAPSGPLYRSRKREGSRIRIHFTHVDGGLCAKNGLLRGFAVRGADGAFVSAKAKIENDTVVV